MIADSGPGCKSVGPDDGCYTGSIYEIVGTYGIDPEQEDLANARLIAAAPDLLEACKALFKHLLPLVEWGEDPDVDRVLVNAEAAIAKASGRLRKGLT